jgi:hypothetical protein
MHTEDRHPWWQVMTIFDPNGQGGDFAYTVGLATKGLPELHMWARPSLGEDPGDDWKFSLRDTCVILNQLSWRLLDDELSVGDTWEDSYDGGLVSVRFRLDPAEPAEALDAFRAGDVPVLPVRWSLHRPEPGPLAPMSDRAQHAAEQLYAELVAEIGPTDMSSIGEWALPSEAHWDPHQKYGPRTPLVLARAAQVASAGAEQWQDVFDNALSVDVAHSASYPAVVAKASAIPVGRDAAVRQLFGDVQRLVDRLGASWGVEGFRAVVDLMVDGDVGGPPELDERTDHNLRRLLFDAFVSFLAVEAVADVVDEQTRLQGQGPVLAGLAAPGFAPGSAWLASPEVVAAFVGLLRGISGEALGQAVHAWWATDAETRGDVGARLQALTVTSASYCPPLGTLLDHEVMHAATCTLERLGSTAWDLQPWATVVTSILTHRVRLDDDAVAFFSATAERFIPCIGHALNAPVPATG